MELRGRLVVDGSLLLPRRCWGVASARQSQENVAFPSERAHRSFPVLLTQNTQNQYRNFSNCLIYVLCLACFHLMFIKRFLS